MLMKVEHPNQKEHQQQPAETPAQGHLLRHQFQGLRQQMQHRHTEHDPGYQTQSQLNAPVGKANQAGQSPAKRRSKGNQNAINHQRCVHAAATFAPQSALSVQFFPPVPERSRQVAPVSAGKTVAPTCF